MLADTDKQACNDGNDSCNRQNAHQGLRPESHGLVRVTALPRSGSITNLHQMTKTREVACGLEHSARSHYVHGPDQGLNAFVYFLM